MVREQIEIVHSHNSTSALGQIVMMCAKSLGIKTVATEHSLFDMSDISGIHLNKFSKFTFREIDAAIAVSTTCKENFCLRVKTDPHNVFIIPNAVDTFKFEPIPSIKSQIKPGVINVVFIARMVQRKGVHLLIGIIPKVIAMFKHVNFIIAGDGPMFIELKSMIEKHNLHSRVELLGSLPHHEVKSVLNRAHIYLNTSLTESFCIAILEAASCGLFVVSTNVGGVPEVLPPSMVYLAQPNETDLLKKLVKAIARFDKIDTSKNHEILQSIYSWHSVAERTEAVYNFVIEQPIYNALGRLKLICSWGVSLIPVSFAYQMLEVIVLFLCEVLMPIKDIDCMRNFDSATYSENPGHFGNHLVSATNKEFPEPREVPKFDPKAVRFSVDRQRRYNTVFTSS